MRSRGLTLVEILCALALTSVALLTMMGVFISALKLMGGARDRAAATEVSRQLLERVDAAGFVYIPDTNLSFDGSTTPATGEFPPSPYPKTSLNGQDFTMLVTVRQLSPTLKSVTAQTRWGPDKQVTLQTYYRK